MRMGSDRVAKRLAQFLLLDLLLQGYPIFRQWVASKWVSEHNPILLEIDKISPILFNSTLFGWNQNPIWRLSRIVGSYNPFLLESLAIQLMSNLKREKETSITWNKARKQK